MVRTAKEKAEEYLLESTDFGCGAYDEDIRHAIDIAIEETRKQLLDRIEEWFHEQRKNNNLFRWHNDEIGDKLLKYLRKEAEWK